MKKTILISALALSLAIPAAVGQLTRQAASEHPTSVPPLSPVAYPLPASYRHIKQQPAENTLPLHVLGHIARKPADRAAGNLKSAPLRAASSRGKIEGYLSYVNCYSYPIYTTGWYTDMTSSSQTMLWGHARGKYQAGFMRADGKLQMFSHTTTQYGGVEGASTTIVDPADGSEISSNTYDLFEGLDQVVYTAAYDADNDVAYVVTMGKTTGSADLVRSFDPATGEFTTLGTLRDAEFPLAFGWCGADGLVYSIAEDGHLRSLNADTGRFTDLGSVGITTSGYSGAMTWSPRDNAFFVILDNEDELPAIYLLPVTGANASSLGVRANSETWSVLVCMDENVGADAPMAVTSLSAEFAGASLNGKLTFAMPSETVEGDALTGTVYAAVFVDGVEKQTVSGGASSAVNSVNLTLTEGAHNISVRTYIVVSGKRVDGQTSSLDIYVGNDTPKAPASVTFNKNRVTWSAVTEGEHGGYVDVSGITYDVYVDDVKMNSAPLTGTTCEVTIPNNGLVTHYAAVTATAAGKTSQKALSAGLVLTDALSIPCTIAPEEGERDLSDAVIAMFAAIDANRDDRTWLYDNQQPFTGGFYYLASVDNDADDWLVLPAMNFPTAGFYRFTMEASALDHYFASDETFEVGVGKTRTAAAMNVFTDRVTIAKSPSFTSFDFVFEVTEPGVNYIAVHAVTPANHYRLYVRNFHVESSSAGETTPAVVTGLTAVARDRGELLADVRFTMPTVDIKGNALPASENVDVRVYTAAGQNEVSALPGKAVETTVPLEQGDNIIYVSTLAGGEIGSTANVEVYGGVDIPATVSINRAVSADNRSMTLTWTVPETGVNGGYVNPDACSYVIYRYLSAGGNWVRYATVDEPTYTFSVDSDEAQAIHQFGVLAVSAAGSADVYATASAVLGRPYTLPMVEPFEADGEAVNLKYEPYLIENLGELYPSWTFADPTIASDNAANESGNALCAYYIGSGQLTMPKFSTVGADNAKLAMSLYLGPEGVDHIELFGSTDDAEMIFLDEFFGATADGWVTKLISLPAALQGKQWVAVTIRVTNLDYSHYFLMDRFEVRNFDGREMAITDIQGPTRGNIGEILSLRATVTNLGNVDAPQPGLTAGLYKGGKRVADMIVADVEGDQTMKPEDKAVYLLSMELTDRIALGDYVVRVSLTEADLDPDNNLRTANLRVLNENVPVVSDLKAELGDEGDVQLSWTVPVTVESFESIEPWSFEAALRDFTNLDNDGRPVYGLSGIVYPGKYDPKAFQVIDIKSSPALTSHSGQHIIAALAPSSTGGGSADDYLISPEITAGSDVAFWGRLITTEFGEESVELLASSTVADDPEAFTLVESFSLTETRWERFEAKLPADARYFALRYSGYFEDKFGVLLDDIAYSPVAPRAVVESYSVNRDGNEIAAGVTLTAYKDLKVPVGFHSYTVKAYARLGAKLVAGKESDSYAVTVDGSGAADAADLGGADISATDGRIIFRGFAADTAFAVYMADGRIAAAGTVDAPEAFVAVAPGFYVVTCGNVTAKLLVD